MWGLSGQGVLRYMPLRYAVLCYPKDVIITLLSSHKITFALKSNLWRWASNDDIASSSSRLIDTSALEFFYFHSSRGSATDWQSHSTLYIQKALPAVCGSQIALHPFCYIYISLHIRQLLSQFTLNFTLCIIFMYFIKCILCLNPCFMCFCTFQSY